MWSYVCIVRNHLSQPVKTAVMKKSIYLFLITLLVPFLVRGSHAMGGEISYTWISGNTYSVSYNFYRDCMGVPAQTVELLTCSSSCYPSFITSLLPDSSSPRQISNVCSGFSTTCNGGTLNGIEKWVYTAIVTLPGSCSDWNFSVTECCRNGTITNLAILVNGSPILSGTNTSVETTLEIDYPGTYTLEARAYDDKGALAFSNRPVEIFAPYHMLTLGGIRDTNNFKFCMVGQTGSNYMVQATTNLTIPTSNWVNVGLMEYTNGIFRYTDPGAVTNRPARYYRAMQQ